MKSHNHNVSLTTSKTITTGNSATCNVAKTVAVAISNENPINPGKTCQSASVAVSFISRSASLKNSEILGNYIVNSTAVSSHKRDTTSLRDYRRECVSSQNLSEISVQSSAKYENSIFHLFFRFGNKISSCFAQFAHLVKM